MEGHVGEKERKRLPDFAALWQRYNDELSPGQRAELRRVRYPEDLRDVPGLYRLLGGTRPDERWLRVVFMLPHLRHAEGAPSLGEHMARHGVSVARLFQVAPSESPNDIEQLRRIAQQIEPAVDMTRLGPMLFFWGRRNKQRIVEDYFVTTYGKKKEEKK